MKGLLDGSLEKGVGAGRWAPFVTKEESKKDYLIREYQQSEFFSSKQQASPQSTGTRPHQAYCVIQYVSLQVSLNVFKLLSFRKKKSFHLKQR